MTSQTKKYQQVLDRSMAYVEAGEGDPIVLLHGNPTSSFLWRKVIPHLSGLGRCIAPDLIGMGDSDKLEPSGPGTYTFVKHREYLDALLESLGVSRNVTFVIHDWGSALGFDWARRHPDAVRGIAYMEAIVRPVTWAEWPDVARQIFQALRSPAGEEMILENNLFVERILPSSILRTLDDDEMNEYRRPFAEAGEGRRPTLDWPRQIPIEGEPADVHRIVSDYSAWLLETDIPKLFIVAEPGAIVTEAVLETARKFPSQKEVTVKGIHFIQEDSGDEIGEAVARWLGEIS